MDTIKIKPLTKEQLIISIDRLTRFKQGKYYRVFYDIITSYLINPKYKKTDLENMSPLEVRTFAEKIINYSIAKLGYACDNDFSINKKIFVYENSIAHLDKNTQILMDNKIDYKSFINLIDENSVKNLQWLKALAEDKDIEQLRQKYSLRFPIKEIVIAEGATEEILLPEFAKLCGYDFDKNGIYVISAGGKNQVVKLYYELIEYIKLPIFVLLDKDAKENLEQISPKLRKTDKIHLLECGEFEDLLPLDLVKRALDYDLSNISIVDKELLLSSEPRTKILEEIFRTRGRHEFKKAEFARLVKDNIKSESDVSAEICEIINEIRTRNPNKTF